MGCICSRENGNQHEKEASKSSVVQVVDPSNREDVSNDCKTDGSGQSMSKHSAKDEVDNKTRIIERPKDGHRRRATLEMELGVKSLQKINSIPGGTKGEQIAAGWPLWLTSVAAEAIQGWVPRSAESFEKMNKIGQGTYSSVYKARDMQTGKIVAMKKVRFVNMDPESVRFMAREIYILRQLDHPNVMKLEALVTSRISSSLYLVFDYMEHDLAGLTTSPKVKKFTEPQIKCYMQQLLRGLEHCHSHKILHRDIKGSNLLVDAKGVLKIGDFGLATHFQPDQSQPMTSRVVTLWYRAPELLLGATSYGVAIDMWSAGCILAELFAGKPIMPGRTEVEQMHKIFKLCGSPSEEYWKKSRLPHATSFKPQQPYKRCVADTFKYLPSSALALLETLLAIEPDNRGTAASALHSEFFTTEPLPCDPSSLPEHPPSKEYDAKLREEEASRRKVEPLKGRGPESVRVCHKESKPQVQVQEQSNKSTSVMYKSEEDCGTGFPIEPHIGTTNNGFSHSNSMVHQSAVGYSWTKKVKDDASQACIRIGYLQHRVALTRQMSNMHPTLGSYNIQSMKDNSVSNKDTTDLTKKRNRIHYSGPLMPPDGNMEDMLKEHERQIQEAVRKSRIDKTKGGVL